MDQVDDEGHVIVLIVEADVSRLDGHLTLLLFLHKVHRQSRSRKRWREQSRARQETVGHRRVVNDHAISYKCVIPRNRQVVDVERAGTSRYLCDLDGANLSFEKLTPFTHYVDSLGRR